MLLRVLRVLRGHFLLSGDAASRIRLFCHPKRDGSLERSNCDTRAAGGIRHDERRSAAVAPLHRLREVELVRDRPGNGRNLEVSARAPWDRYLQRTAVSIEVDRCRPLDIAIEANRSGDSLDLGALELRISLSGH